MSPFRSYRALSVVGWFLVLFSFNLAWNWLQNADRTSLYITLTAIDRLTTLPELALSAAAVYWLLSERSPISTTRLLAYFVVGLAAVVVAFGLSYPKQVRSAPARILRSLSGIAIAKNQPLSSVELFQKLSPSVYVVESLAQNGDTLMSGSAVAVDRNFLITNCHVVQSGSFLRIKRGTEKWSATLVEAAPDHDLCGLKPSGLNLSPVDVLPSSKLATGERVYAIGAPEGLELTFSEGIVSALRDTEGVHMIQTSAPISPGSSGGGLFDAQGNLVGITTFYLKEGQSLNFALPGEWVADVLARSNMPAGADRPTSSDAALESTAWIEIGEGAAKREDYQLAVDSYRKSADLQQSDAYRAWFELAKLAEMAAGMNSPSDAFKSWSQPFQLSPEAAESSAISDFEEAIKLKPDYSEAWLELATVHRTRKEYDQAISAAKEATRLAPGDWRGWLTLGICDIDTESYADAIGALQQGRKLAPDGERKSLILFLVGRAYAKEGDREHVMDVYQELRSSDPKMAESFFREDVLPKRGD
jgi:tetratricopeptide (TPR) repeat protein